MARSRSRGGATGAPAMGRRALGQAADSRDFAHTPEGLLRALDAREREGGLRQRKVRRLVPDNREARPTGWNLLGPFGG